MGQPGHELAPVWDAGAIDEDLVCCAGPCFHHCFSMRVRTWLLARSLEGHWLAVNLLCDSGHAAQQRGEKHRCCVTVPATANLTNNNRDHDNGYQHWLWQKGTVKDSGSLVASRGDPQKVLSPTSKAFSAAGEDGQLPLVPPGWPQHH